MGLGLYISSKIVKEHHGDIWVDSEDGRGATFYFSLPLER
jgi:signal transduction histidine kinase